MSPSLGGGRRRGGEGHHHRKSGKKRTKGMRRAPSIWKKGFSVLLVRWSGGKWGGGKKGEGGGRLLANSFREKNGENRSRRLLQKEKRKVESLDQSGR